MMSKDFIVNIAILFELFIILWGEFKTAAEKKNQKDKLNHKIIAVLIRHGGKMNCTGISRYLNLSIETVTDRMKELERN
jgi:DNA-binding MarR family transcriptional regulator